MKIKNAKPDDSGVYGLSVKNPYGGDTTECEVIVVPSQPGRDGIDTSSFKKPAFIIPLAPETGIKEGQSIYLNCTVDGDPEPQVCSHIPLASVTLHAYYSKLNYFF